MSRKLLLHSSIRSGLVLAVMSIVGPVSMAATQAATAPQTVTKETREKLAVLHEQMAACLRSDKAIADCHAEMMKGCKESMGDQSCPMMGKGMGMGMGMGMGKHSHSHAQK
ncbi:MAG TPA: hypothetical protein VI653_08180 [Steroidobacteraceae bacterium]